MKVAMESHIEKGFAVLQNCVRAGRKLKNDAKVSFKEKPFLLRFKIPFAIVFSMRRDDYAEIIRKMLKADAVYLEEDGYDSPFALSDQAGEFPYFGGDVQSDDVSAQLWTKQIIWQ